MAGSPPVHGCRALDRSVWGAHLDASTLSHQLQQKPDASGYAVGANETIRGYGTISYMAATTLAGSTPVELLAEERYLLYWRIKKLREMEGGLTVRNLKALKTQARARVLDKWSTDLADPRGFGRQTAEVVRPSLPEMVGRRGRGLSFHLVQVLTGHGCLGRYLHLIRKEPTGCHHCPEPVDLARHTLAECEAWSQQHRVLARAVGYRVEELSLPRTVQAMCGREDMGGGGLLLQGHVPEGGRPVGALSQPPP
ncbi:uncharacterized protein LOC105184113 [Harpegnathos saltator]|uniref:uncharacterized protein LOC105184113 n=1 Tax=Harpegnathos saltator TaxID=610380 RepID=UPI00058FB149|nr:uncharacterized protein LOC105184113 [Harpegnathos saltator]